MRLILRHHPILATLFALALVATLLFAVRLGAALLYWSDPAHRDQPVAGWMTPGYVAHSWDLPPEAVQRALGPGTDLRGRTLDEIAAAQGRDPAALVAALEAAIAAHRAGAGQ